MQLTQKEKRVVDLPMHIQFILIVTRKRNIISSML